ncbi:MAG TPA: GIY-YIG nuclease family protein [Mariprofundaceae bacterium]|nr:GIY-YIG nuclease family protein [Mariprofundaceae bacterium]
MAAEVVWYLYMIRLENNHLYTGITTDIDRRFAEHQSGKGAKYLRGKGKMRLVFTEKIGGHSSALKVEARIKKMPKFEKERLINGERNIQADLEQSSVGM